jgi:hypothetical protein
MYARNAASPERLAIGAVVQISDGAVQTSGVSIKVLPIGTTASAGGGTTAYEEGIVHYLPTQAETNYTSFIVIAYKTGCIPVSQTVITSAAGIAEIRSGLSTVTTAQVNAEVDVAIADAALATAANLATAQTAINDIPTNAELAARTLDSADYATAAALGTVDTVADAIKAKTDNLPSDPADQSIIIAATDAVLAAIGALASAGAIADAVLDEVVDGTKTLRESIRLANAALGGKASGLGTATATFRNPDDDKNRIVATVDADGNRTAVALDLT